MNRKNDDKIACHSAEFFNTIGSEAVVRTEFSATKMCMAASEEYC